MNKAKFIFLLVYVLSHTICLAQNNTIVVAQKNVYVTFSVFQADRYPLFFATIVQEDSINIKVNNIDSLVSDLYSSKYYVPTTISAFQKSYEILFGGSERVYDICSLFISDFNEKCNIFQCENDFILNTGERVSVNYVGLYGVFLNLDRKYKSKCYSSLGVQRKDIPDNILVPISIIDYYKPNFRINLVN